MDPLHFYITFLVLKNRINDFSRINYVSHIDNLCCQFLFEFSQFETVCTTGLVQEKTGIMPLTFGEVRPREGKQLVQVMLVSRKCQRRDGPKLDGSLFSALLLLCSY